MTALTGNRVPGTLCHLPMVTAGGVDGLPRPAQGQSLQEREYDDRSLTDKCPGFVFVRRGCRHPRTSALNSVGRRGTTFSFRSNPRTESRRLSMLVLKSSSLNKPHI